MQHNVKVKLLQEVQQKGGKQVEKLKARIDEKFSTRADFAKAIGVDPSVLSRSLATGNWRADRIEKAVEVLKISAKDIPDYFFPSYVAKNATKEKV